MSVELVVVSMSRFAVPGPGVRWGGHSDTWNRSACLWNGRLANRLTPWIVLDLPRAAWVVERRAAELTAEERQIVREAAARMLLAVDNAG